MANELAFDLLHGVGNENDIFKHSYATFFEQLQETLKVSMIASEKELGDEACELIKKLDCVVGCAIPQGSGIHEPPSLRDIVVIMNTMTSNFKDGKFIGMGSKELLEQFSSYPALRAQHSYGPQGHRGLSVLIFESSAVGYLEAERLHNNFLEQRLGRSASNSCTDEVLPGGERQLYGFMAVKEDLDLFNQHCQGKSKIKYELKSYQEAVLNEIKTMREDSQQVIRFKDKLEEERKRVKTFERSVNTLSRNLQQKMKDIYIFKKRVKSLHEENKEEMETQEIFYKDQIKILEAKVKELDKKLKESDAASPLNTGEPEAAMADLIEEYDYTPHLYNSNLSIDEDLSLKHGKLPNKYIDNET